VRPGTENELERLMVGVETVDGVSVQVGKRCRIELQGMLGLLGCSFEEGIDKRGEMCAKVFENDDAAGNVSGQQGRAMATAGSACGEEGAGCPLPCQARDPKQVLVLWL
jgi:hypothetical protein